MASWSPCAGEVGGGGDVGAGARGSWTRGHQAASKWLRMRCTAQQRRPHRHSCTSGWPRMHHAYPNSVRAGARLPANGCASTHLHQKTAAQAPAVPFMCERLASELARTHKSPTLAICSIWLARPTMFRVSSMVWYAPGRVRPQRAAFERASLPGCGAWVRQEAGGGCVRDIRLGVRDIR